MVSSTPAEELMKTRLEYLVSERERAESSTPAEGLREGVWSAQWECVSVRERCSALGMVSSTPAEELMKTRLEYLVGERGRERQSDRGYGEPPAEELMKTRLVIESVCERRYGELETHEDELEYMVREREADTHAQ